MLVNVITVNIATALHRLRIIMLLVRYNKSGWYRIYNGRNIITIHPEEHILRTYIKQLHHIIYEHNNQYYVIIYKHKSEKNRVRIASMRSHDNYFHGVESLRRCAIGALCADESKITKALEIEILYTDDYTISGDYNSFVGDSWETVGLILYATGFNAQYIPVNTNIINSYNNLDHL